MAVDMQSLKRAIVRLEEATIRQAKAEEMLAKQLARYDFIHETSPMFLDSTGQWKIRIERNDNESHS